MEEHIQVIDFPTFLSFFRSDDEVHNLEILDLLDIDYEQLAEQKNKVIEFIDAASIIIQEKNANDLNTQSDCALMSFLSEKLQEMINNEINIQIFANNLHNVQGISYSDRGVKIFFKQT